MRFSTILLTIAAIGSSTLVNAVPIDKRDDTIVTPYEITSPTANATVQVNQNAVINWNKGTDNSPINIALVPGSDSSLSSDSITISEGISGSIGTLIYKVPSSVENENDSSLWRVAISHGSDSVTYSAPFYISNTASQQQIQQPSFTASSTDASYSAVASITILGPDGKPLYVGGDSQSSDASSVGAFVMSYVVLPAIITGYILM
ncbi:hypothetical protein BCR42DRAFT_429261 [Absidia repens]|uniref:Yeast cell wall synthesis Kre9/Knh1-like N-terminal domain-containing protein n=1 Tax=Absidia repens TaxID=90262 RepID=A0A1X2HYI9_9FUNG|nr:hypothetical protein BCR42DRAFT_429261 [Absidia repens]